MEGRIYRAVEGRRLVDGLRDDPADAGVQFPQRLPGKVELFLKE